MSADHHAVRDPAPAGPAPAAPGGAVRSRGPIGHFYVEATLDPVATAKSYNRIADGVIGVIKDVPCSRFSVKMVIDVEFSSGLPDDKERILQENCDALGLRADFLPRS